MGNPEFADLPWVPPRSFSAGRPEGPPRFITIHYTAGHEGWTNAEDGAAYDQRRTDGTSSHFYVDADSVVQCVATWDRSHTALYHGNLWGIHLELCGTAQTRDQWLDDVSRRTIRNAAAVAARCMTKWRIPLVRIVGTGVRSLTARGVCGHYDWTIGWPEDNGDHTDPGPQFPWDVLFADIASALNGGDDMFEDRDRVTLQNIERVATNADLTTWLLAKLEDTISGPKAPDGKSYPYENKLGAALKTLGDRLAAIEAKLADPVDEAALAAQLAERLQPLAPGATVDQVREILASVRLTPGA